MALKENVLSLPKSPGVYIMKNKDGAVIYVGKAKNLKNRVASYFNASVKNVKTLAMVSHVTNFEYIVVLSEQDAFALENNLIKKHKPFYNILLKDDKQYPYIKINTKLKFPKIEIARKIKNDGAKYFGPYFQGMRARDIVNVINYAFSLKKCNLNFESDKKRLSRPCLNYSIGLCDAPCVNKINAENYKKIVDSVVSFLAGNTITVERQLLEKMQKASESENFELAIELRDQISVLNKLKKHNINILNKKVNLDIFAMAENDLFSVITMMVVREGKLIGVEHFSCMNVLSEGLFENFISQFYLANGIACDKIIVNQKIENAEEFAKFISPDKRVEIAMPIKGTLKKLIIQAENNALEFLRKNIDSIKHKELTTTMACRGLQKVLNLKTYPQRIECYDISHISGTNKVASMVVFTNGESDKKMYRKFKIKTVEGNNDFASLTETLKRRIDNLNSDDLSFSSHPDLIIIDGGKGQLSSVLKIIKSSETNIDVISLAKKQEEVFTEDSKEPIILKRTAQELKLLQRIRDEAHRFAVTFHKSLRDKKMTSSKLDNIAGLGKQKRNALIAKFKTVSAIKKASKDQLMQVSGIGSNLAENIINALK